MRLDALVTHPLSLDVNLEVYVEPAGALIAAVAEILERLRIIRVAFECFRTEWSESLHRYDIRRNRRREILRQERPERLVFPRLNVACRPVVDQAYAEDMLFGLADRNRPTEFVSLSYKKPELHFVVEILARDKDRRLLSIA